MKGEMQMLTIEALKEFGVNTEEGLARCMNNQAFYLKLIDKVLEDKNFASLEQAIAEGDLAAAFEAAHSLKGVLGNLSITPMFEPVKEMTEFLRARTEMDYQPYVEQIKEKRAQLKQLINE
jgi:HPt (histidine-containing phosphotransfer) domain-containing protein